MVLQRSFTKRFGKELRYAVISVDSAIVFFSFLFSFLVRVNFSTAKLATAMTDIRFFFTVCLSALIAVIYMRWGGLYETRRISKVSEEIFIQIKAIFVTTLLLLALSFVLQVHISRLTIGFFSLVSLLTLATFRISLRSVLYRLRRKGFNKRFILIIGSGEMGRLLAEKIQNNSWMGLEIAGFLDDKYTLNQRISGIPVVGKIEQVKDILRVYKIDQIFIALPLGAYKKVDFIMKRLHDEVVTIRLVPQISYMMRAAMENIEGIPIITLVESPTQGLNAFFKRVFDISFAAFSLILISPLLAVVALLIKATSDGPIFYLQERMGLDGNVFQMLKFRSMRMGAEEQTGAVWAKKDDPRTTPIGAFLRKTSLDELPQFFNVLRGDMSIVGPRPERPPLIQKFKKEIPMYMWRHKIKTGITGWAQVNGWRGDTSLSKRIECDLYYIENWSFLFDLKIIWLTLWKGFVHKNAY